MYLLMYSMYVGESPCMNVKLGPGETEIMRLKPSKCQAIDVKDSMGGYNSLKN